jgi:hypothetical protein
VLHALLLQHPPNEHLQGDLLEFKNAVPTEYGVVDCTYSAVYGASKSNTAVVYDASAVVDSCL